MLRRTGPFTNLEEAVQDRLRFLVAALKLIAARQRVQDSVQVVAFRSHNPLLNRQGVLQKGLRFLVAALELIKLPQAPLGCSHPGIVFAECSDAQLQHAAQQWFGLGIAPFILVKHAEIVKNRGLLGVLRAEGLFSNQERLLVETLCVSIAVLRPAEFAKIIQRRGDVWMFRTQALLANRQCALEQGAALRRSALLHVKHAQVVQQGGYLRVVCAEGFFAYG